jgi:eukaryotic-like serine/threonine-protein kinase
VQLALAKLRATGAGNYPAAEALLHEAMVSAAEGKDDVLAASAWTGLLYVVGELDQHLDEAAVIRALGPVAIARAQSERLTAAWLTTEGSVLVRMRKHAEARATLERAVALREKILPPDHPDLAASVSALGNALLVAADYAAARVVTERALALREKALGPDHPDVARTLDNLASAYLGLGLQMGEATQALARGEQALGIMEKALGSGHPDLGEPLATTGRALVRLGRLDEALPRLQRAIAVQEKALGPTSTDLSSALLGMGELHLARHRPEDAAPVLERALALDPAETANLEVRLTLAEALWQLGRDRPRALALAEQARTTYERIGHRPGLARATRWLAEHEKEGGNGSRAAW